MAEHSESGAQASGQITMEQAGRLLKVTPDRVRQLIREGYIPKGDRGRVLLVGAVQGYISFLQEVAKKTTKTAADSRVRDARAAEIELRNAVRMRDLIPLDEATAEYDALVAAVREELDGIPQKFARDDLDRRRALEAIIYEAKKQIADALDEAKEAARTGKASRRGRTDDA